MTTLERPTMDYFIFGRANYHDPGSIHHHYTTEFCLQLTGVTGSVHFGEPQMDNAGLEPIKGSSSCCPYHNCTDNQCKKRALN
jgi:hypothetical protein